VVRQNFFITLGQSSHTFNISLYPDSILIGISTAPKVQILDRNFLAGSLRLPTQSDKTFADRSFHCRKISSGQPRDVVGRVVKPYAAAVRETTSSSPPQSPQQSAVCIPTSKMTAGK
jgi:hypothetical protein